MARFWKSIRTGNTAIVTSRKCNLPLVFQVPSTFTHLFIQQTLSTYSVPALCFLGETAVESNEAYNKVEGVSGEGTHRCFQGSVKCAMITCRK